MAKYLPVHKKMRHRLRVGMGVVHNGGGTRQGLVGKIIYIVGNEVTIHFTGKNFTQKYSWDWFLDNFHINILDIEKMKVTFDGRGYLGKYRLFIVMEEELASSQRNQHKDNKAIVEARDCGYTSIVENKNELDPLDESGEYVLLVKSGVLSTGHKTQRIAEVLAAKHTKEKSCWVGIMKLVAESKPRYEADIIRK